MPNFMSVLDQAAETVERPKPKPAGWYHASVAGAPSVDKRTVQGEEKEIVSFKLKMMAAQEGVDADALEAGPPIADWPPFTKDFWVESDAGFGLLQFLRETLGIEKTGKTLREMLSDSMGKQLLAELIHKPGQNKTTGEMEIYTNVGKTAKL